MKKDVKSNQIRHFWHWFYAAQCNWEETRKQIIKIEKEILVSDNFTGKKHSKNTKGSKNLKDSPKDHKDDPKNFKYDSKDPKHDPKDLKDDSKDLKDDPKPKILNKDPKVLNKDPKGIKNDKNQDCAYCEQCGKFFQFKSRLTQHPKSFQNLYVCKYCPKTFKYFKTMKKLKNL